MPNYAPSFSSSHQPIAVDLFAGVGGFSLGIEQAGFNIIVAVEKDPIHAAAYAFNFPQTQVFCADITTFDSKKIRALYPGAIDLVFGGPPCQGFSVIGKRNLEDVRNELIFHFCRLVKELQPQFFVMENVPGLNQGKYKKIFEQLQEDFQRIGYSITPPQVLNAANFGVPQQRQRLFLLGTKNIETIAILEAKFYSHPEVITVKDAIGDLPNLDDFLTLQTKDQIKLKPARLELLEASASFYVKKLRGLVPDPGNFAAPRNWNRLFLTSSLRTNHNATSIARFKQTLPGKLVPVSRLRRLDWQGFSHTLRAGTGSQKGSFTSPRPIHPQYPRVISVREAARLHSFPDWFRFHVTKWHGFRQVGNAVPPLLGRVLGERIRQALGIEPVKPEGEIMLGDIQLLKLKFSQAQQYWQNQSDSNSTPEEL